MYNEQIRGKVQLKFEIDIKHEGKDGGRIRTQIGPFDFSLPIKSNHIRNEIPRLDRHFHTKFNGLLLSFRDFESSRKCHNLALAPSIHFHLSRHFYL